MEERQPTHKQVLQGLIVDRHSAAFRFASPFLQGVWRHLQETGSAETSVSTEAPAPPIGHCSHLVFINLITCSASSVYQAAPWPWDGARFCGEKGYICTSCYGRRLLTHNCWVRSLFLRSGAGFFGCCSKREGRYRLRAGVDSLKGLLTLMSYLPLFLVDGVASRPLFYCCLFLLVFFGKKG